MISLNYSRLTEKVLLLRAQIALTFRCNLRCLHCFESKDCRQELTISEIRNLLDGLRESGCLSVTFTGGEILLRKDLIDILQSCRQKDFSFNLITNGSLLTEKLIKHIKSFSPALIQISLYGATKNTHESITGIKGSFEKTLNSISLLAKEKISFRITATVMRDNIHELKLLRQIAEERNWDLLLDYCVMPRCNGSRHPLRHRITEQQIKELVRALRSQDSDFLRERDNFEYQDYFYFLPLARNECYISAQGIVYPSCSLRIPLGSIRKKSFKDIWLTSRQGLVLRMVKLEDFQCFSCKNNNYCHWDPGLAWLEHGDFRAAPAEICRLTNAGLRRDGKLLLKE